MARTLTTEIVNAAIEGLEARKQHIDQQIAELRAMVSGNGSRPASSERPAVARTGRRRKMSAAGREAIAAAQRRRWAAKKAGTKNAANAAPKKKRALSAAGRKAIAEAQKKRWAAKKAAAQAQ